MILLSLIITVLLYFIKEPMLLFFGASESITPFANQYFSIYPLGTILLLPLGIQYAIVDGFTAISQMRFSLLIYFWRKSVYLFGLFIHSVFFKAKAVFYAESISDFSGPAASILIHFLFMKRVLNKRQQIPTEFTALETYPSR